MKDKNVFVDTNILVYAHDLDAGKKYKTARECVTELWNRNFPPAISVQVLQELYVNLIRKKVSGKEALNVVKDYMQWNVIDNSPELLLKGIIEKERWKISFGDGLIIAAAKRSHSKIILSEDLNPEQDYGGILVENPFA